VGSEENFALISHKGKQISGSHFITDQCAVVKLPLRFSALTKSLSSLVLWVLSPSAMYLVSWESWMRRSRWGEKREGEFWAFLQYDMQVLCK
jgi:hypothetical protein